MFVKLKMVCINELNPIFFVFRNLKLPLESHHEIFFTQVEKWDSTIANVTNNLVAMNLTEMEAKVREATNNEPWGAPSTLMSQIAAGTYNYREREEIISFIFRRFTEKAANEWRQIYKALQLLDYLIRNGSERIIDDVRSNLSLIQMLKSFHYIDSKGRDQGINVRNRAKTLINLLNDDAQIRSERKKARANAKKFGGVSSAAFGGASSIVTGPGMDDDFSSRVFGDGGVYGARYGDSAEEYNQNAASASNENFEEYEVNPKKSSKTTGSSSVNATSTKSKPQPAEPDLLADLDFGSQSSQPPAQSQPQPANDDDDDEFDDFQSAPTSQPQSNLNNLLSLYQPQQTFFQPQPQSQPQMFQSQPQSQPSYNQSFNSSSSVPTVNKVQPKSNDAFSSLFTSAKTKTRTPSGTKPATPATPVTPAAKDDDFGDFSSNNNSKPAPAPASNGEVDLLDL